MMGSTEKLSYPLFRRRRCLVRDLRQLQLCWINWYIEVEIGFQEKCRRKILIWTH